MKKLTKAAWSRVTEVACDIVNASEVGDRILVEVYTDRLMVTLDELEMEFGAHPELYDTRADFLEDPVERMRLYERGLQLAEERGDIDVRSEILESISILSEEYEGCVGRKN